MVVDADNTEVQKSALFALSQLPDDEGLLSLIKIAETHSNPEIRKQAIFWLSQCEDPRALEAITKIVRK
jgi:HEAT repeat protein